MSGPWEAYAPQQNAESDGPWAAYASAKAATPEPESRGGFAQGAGNLQNLHKERFEMFKKSFAEGGNGVVVWVTIGCNISKCYRIIGGLFEFPAGEHPRGIPVKQQRHQHRRMIGLDPFSRIGGRQFPEIKLRDYVDDKSRQLAFPQPVLNGRWKKVLLGSIGRNKMGTHRLGSA